jgi:hypothetical protein
VSRDQSREKGMWCQTLNHITQVGDALALINDPT